MKPEQRLALIQEAKSEIEQLSRKLDLGSQTPSERKGVEDKFIKKLQYYERLVKRHNQLVREEQQGHSTT